MFCIIFQLTRRAKNKMKWDDWRRGDREDSGEPRIETKNNSGDLENYQTSKAVSFQDKELSAVIQSDGWL